MTLDRTHEDVTPIPKQTRPWNCKRNIDTCTRKAPCRGCLGERNRRGGLAKQRAARKALKVPSNRFHGQDGNEEAWRGAKRVEVKSGKFVQGVATLFLAAESQSETNRAIGDTRGFVLVVMPRGWGNEGLVIERLSQYGGME